MEKGCGRPDSVEGAGFINILGLEEIWPVPVHAVAVGWRDVVLVVPGSGRLIDNRCENLPKRPLDGCPIVLGRSQNIEIRGKSDPTFPQNPRLTRVCPNLCNRNFY